MQSSVAVIGQSQSGKSSLVGTLICEVLSAIPPEARPAVVSGYSDTLDEERERGMSIVSKKSWFLGEREDMVAVIDTPGHRDYLTNMIRGAAQADCALLTVSALTGEFEEGVSENGQTCEHALIAFTLGLRQMIVVVTKMDKTEPPYSEDRFNEVKEKVGQIIAKLRYKLEDVPFIPVSVVGEENVIQPRGQMPWYTGWECKETSGYSVHEALKKVQPYFSSHDDTLRIPIDKVYNNPAYGTIVSGRVETGMLASDAKVTFAPQNLSAVVSELKRGQEYLVEANRGDIVEFVVKDIPAEQLREGSVAGASDTPLRAAASFIAQVNVKNHGEKMTVGYTAVVHCHTASVACRFEELLTKVNGETKEKEEKPTSVSNEDFLFVRLVPTEPMVVEAYSECSALGRVVMSDQGQVVAVGIVKSVEKIGE